MLVHMYVLFTVFPFDYVGPALFKTYINTYLTTNLWNVALHSLLL